MLGKLPQGVAHFGISRFQSLSGLDSSRLTGLSIETLARLRLRDYAGLEGPFPAIVSGAALGGAAAHLALALNAPFLPQAFVLTIKGGSRDGDVDRYFQRSAGLAKAIAADNPGVLTIQHYDPVHDGWVTRFANHLRVKLLDLPTAYVEFIRRTLEAGGAICHLDCGAQWLRYRTGERNYFQVGGWGGIPPEEFPEGSERLRRYCRSAGLRRREWSLSGYPLETGPESEWGCERAYGEALESFCQQEGYRFVRISLPEPADYSTLAFHAARQALEDEGREPAGVLIEMFTQFDATAVRETGLLPLWLVFNTQDNLAFLARMLPQCPEDRPVFFSPLATFSRTPDLVPWSAWVKALEGRDWRNIGARASHYPGDALALVAWAEPLRRWVQEHRQPVRACLSAEDLWELARQGPSIDRGPR
jgi:hypothetical protein